MPFRRIAPTTTLARGSAVYGRDQAFFHRLSIAGQNEKVEKGEKGEKGEKENSIRLKIKQLSVEIESGIGKMAKSVAFLPNLPFHVGLGKNVSIAVAGDVELLCPQNCYRASRLEW